MERVTEQQLTEYNNGMFEGWDIDYWDIDYWAVRGVVLLTDRFDRITIWDTGDVVAPYCLPAEVKAGLLALFIP